jgi:hypothetical protein
LDQQFHNPKFSNREMGSYPTQQFRKSISELNKIDDTELSELAGALETTNRAVSANGIIAPAVVYQGNSAQIIDLNARLYNCAKSVGNNLGIPTYATVVLARSATSTEQVTDDLLSSVTGLNADGWYYAYEFPPERLPANIDDVYRCCSAGLTLACTGSPVLHAYAGPIGLLSMGFGASAVGIGHSQTLWKFTADHWQGLRKRGGTSRAPARLFSRALWGTIVAPDELAQLSTSLQREIISPSPYSQAVESDPTFVWPKREAYKHLVYIISSEVETMANARNPKANMHHAIALLSGAEALYRQIRSGGIAVRDEADSYQGAWKKACHNLLESRSQDYDLLELLS